MDIKPISLEFNKYIKEQIELQDFYRSLLWKIVMSELMIKE